MSKTKTVLNISKHDAIGRRFNNLDAADKLSEFGWKSYNCSWTEAEGDPTRSVTAKGSANRTITKIIGRMAGITGDLNGYYRNANSIKKLQQYREADVLHYHIVHEKWLSIKDWISLAKNKPVVWTWHDPYMVTGHCIYPIDCDRYQGGCVSCTHLDYHFPIQRDRSQVNLQEKVAAVKAIDPLVIVASDYMRDLVQKSLHTSKLRVKTIPFGIEFTDTPDLAAAKHRLSIPSDHIVFGFRAVSSDYKGTYLIIEALTNLCKRYGTMPITVIAFQETGKCQSFANNVNLIETGWVSDSTIQNYYSAMDYFLMPSRVEAFGMMAIEAMAAGACPIVTHGTALPTVVQAPIHGLSVEHSINGIEQAILSEILNVGYRRSQRSVRIAFARQAYSLDKFCQELSTTYDEEIEYCADHRRSA